MINPISTSTPITTSAPSALGRTPGSGAADVAPSIATGAGTADEPFSDMIRGMLSKANAPHSEANAAMQNLMTGDSDNVHGVVMSVVKADMSFRFMLELRNRLTEAYQEVMRMQV